MKTRFYSSRSPAIRSLLLAICLAMLSTIGSGGLCAADKTPASLVGKPNIVLFLADDHGRLDSSVFGSTQVKTPAMQSLADAGMVFDHAYVASPSCGPSRAALFSGLMPARNGAEPNHTPPRPETQTMVKALQAAGYEVVAFGKVAHGANAKLAGFDEATDAVKEQLATTVQDFLRKRHQKDKPLCLMVGDHRPHVSWSRNSAYDPGTVTLPDHFIDTPETREHWARYLTDITSMDKLMGQVDKMARDYFGSEDFVFIYSSDHGAQWPLGKWNLYDAGSRVPLLVRWPGRIEAGKRTDAMVSWIDIMPTLVDLAGGTVPEAIDGKSFVNVLFGKTTQHREVIYTTHSGDGNKNVYPIRAVQTKQYKYIRNLRPDCFHSNHSDIDRKDGAGAYWDSWDEAAKSDPKAAEVVKKYYQRPAVEFFDLEKDPHEQNNLASLPEQASRIKEMSVMLDEWMKEQGDTQATFNEPYLLSGPTPFDFAKEKERRLMNRKQ